MSDNSEWINAQAATEMLGRTDRQLRRYANSGRVRTRLQGQRVQYHRGDIEQLASELGEDTRPRVPEQQIIPASDLLTYIREIQQALNEAAAREGYLRAQLEQRLALSDERMLRDQLAEQQARADNLQKELEEKERQISEFQKTQSKPWWKLW